MADNVGVVANLVARVAAEVTTEVSQAGVELLEDDGLRLNLADLLGDDPGSKISCELAWCSNVGEVCLPLSHLLEDDETLLDDLDLLSAADNLLLLNDNLLERGEVVKVVRAVEVIEVVQGGDSTPVVEGVGGTGD